MYNRYVTLLLYILSSQYNIFLSVCELEEKIGVSTSLFSLLRKRLYARFMGFIGFMGFMGMFNRDTHIKVLLSVMTRIFSQGTIHLKPYLILFD